MTHELSSNWNTHTTNSPSKCATILKGIAHAAGLNTAIFTTCTFQKLGVMAGINTRVDADTIFHLGGWHNPATFHWHYMMTEILSTYTDILFDPDEQEDISKNNQLDSNSSDNMGTTTSLTSSNSHSPSLQSTTQRVFQG